MTEPDTISNAAPKKKRGLLIPIASVILLLAIAGFVASRAGIDKALVKQQLDNFIAQTKEKARERGKDIDITYGRLEVVGSFASRHVLIHNPVLVVKPTDALNDKERDGLRISTVALEIYPQVKDFSSLRLQAPNPIDFANESEPNKSLLKIKNNTPMILTMAKRNVADVPYTEIVYQSPSEMDFTYLREQQAEGEEEQTPRLVPVYQNLHISTAQGSGFSSNLSDDKNMLGEAKIDFRNLVITPDTAPEGTVKIAELSGNWSNQLNENKANAVKGILKFGPITSDNASAPYLPVALDIDASYEGALAKTAEAVANIQSQDSLIVLKNFSITSKDASLKAAANFTANASDIIPVGNANISITNVPFILGELRTYKVLNERNEPAVNALLQQITGTTPAEWKDVTIPIERARGGAFKIGQTTFEELFALLWTQSMKINPSPPPSVEIPGVDSGDEGRLAPQLPPSNKPKLAPIEVPDPSVRG